MLSLAQYFAALAPNEYANAATKVQVQAIYPIAQETVKASIWGKFTNQAVVLYSLHYWALNIANTSPALTGSLIAAETGESSKKRWSDPMAGRVITEDFETTKWGLQYLNVRKRASGSHLFVGVGCAPSTSSVTEETLSSIPELFEPWLPNTAYGLSQFRYTSTVSGYQIWQSNKANNLTDPTTDGQTDWTLTSIPAALTWLNLNKADA